MKPVLVKSALPVPVAVVVVVAIAAVVVVTVAEIVAVVASIAANRPTNFKGVGFGRVPHLFVSAQSLPILSN